jgi:integrase
MSAGALPCSPAGASNRSLPVQMLAELVRKAGLSRAGIRDPFEEHRKRPLAEHLKDWEASLRANGCGEECIQLKRTRVRAALDGCKFVFPGDLSADRLELFLARLREEDGRSIQTSNDYLQAVKQFARWLVENDRLDRSPLARVKGGNVKLDRRHDRRDLAPAELTKLLDAAGASATAFRGLDGRDRYYLYLTACGTGFRSSELAALTPESFTLDTAPPTASLAAESTKNKKPVCQPLPPAVAEALRDYLADRPAGCPVWPGSWVQRSADMFKADLAAAGIPYTVEGPHGLLYADFHALRHSFITLLERAGIGVKAAQELARHSDVRLTLQRYTHKTLHDLGTAIERLPSFLPSGPGTGRESLAATGTDGPFPGLRAYTPLTGSPAKAQQCMTTCDNADGPGGCSTGASEVFDALTVNNDKEGMIRLETERAGFEPAVGFDPHAALAKRCFRPLSHLSETP